LRKITKAEVKAVTEELMIAQKNICPICKKSLLIAKPVDRVLDHNHTTGLVRAVLHRGCNGAEGKVRQVLESWGRAGDNELLLIQTLANMGEFWRLHLSPQTEYIHHTHLTGPERMAAANKEAMRKQFRRR